VSHLAYVLESSLNRVPFFRSVIAFGVHAREKNC